MQERRAPQVTVHGQQAAGRVADVIGSGSDEEHPSGRTRAVTALAVAVVALAAVVLTQRNVAPAPPTAGTSDLALVGTGGALSAQWGYGGRLDVSLPLLVRNDGGPVTIASLALDGTSMAQPAVDVDVVPGGRFPVTLRQTMSCPAGAAVPGDASLRLQVRRDGGERTEVLALPDGLAEALGRALADQCSAVPLEQAVVLRSEQDQVVGDVVEVRVRAENLATTGVQLLSVEPAAGLAVTVATPGASEVALPLVLGPDPVRFRLSVAVEDCEVAAARDLQGTVAVADVVYDDGRGSRAVKAVRGEFPGLRDVVERTC